MVVSKCARCGHNIEVFKIKEVTDIKCPHCNKEFAIDNNTKRRSYVYVALIILAISFFISFISQLFDISPYILLIPMLIVAIFLQSWVLYLMAKFNKVSYIKKN